MLNRHSIPVWMLADSMLGILLFTGMCVTALSPLALRALRPALDHEKLVRDHKQLTQAIADAQNEQNQSAKELLDNQTRLRAAQQIIALRDEQLEQAQADAAAAKRVHQHEKAVRRELIPIRGDFARTMFVVDLSGSMGTAPPEPLDRPNWGSGGTAWSYVQKQIDIWLRHLPVESFRLICFNNQIVEFPAVAEGWVSGDNARVKACAFLSELEPGGATLTERALEQAMQWNPTSVVLITDGGPTNVDRQFEPAQQSRIVTRVIAREWRVPINVIALNGYNDKNFPGLLDFLHKLAARSGGGFMAL